MYCQKCRKPNDEGSQFCSSCGQPLSSFPVAPPQVQESTIVPSVAHAETSGKAIASLICGLLGFIFPAAIAAVILGHISRSEIRKSGGQLTGSGMALVGLIFGYLSLAFIPILIIAAIAIPNLLRARIAANESSAVASVRTINTAEIAYSLAHPDVGYTCSLPDLNSPAASIGDLTTGEKHGYIFRVTTCTPKNYAIVAVPKVRDQLGQRAFCAREDYVIRYDPNGSGEECLAHGGEI